MIREFQVSILLCAVATLIPSCKNTLASFESKPNALGVSNEIVVICDDAMWEGAVGDTVDFYFGSPYPIMPQPEPMFDLRQFTPGELASDPLRKELRTYLVIANISDDDSPTTTMIKNDLGVEKIRRAREDKSYFSSIGQDKWARGQLLVYIFGATIDDINEKLVQAFPTIAERVRQHDLVQINAATYLNGEARSTSNIIQEKFGVTLKIPGDYNIAKNEKNYIWLRKDTPDRTSNIAIKRFPYREQSQLNKEGILNMRDRMGIYIDGSTQGSFMRTNAEDLPVYLYQKEIAGKYAVEARGIWELTDDFLGGPFISYAIVDEDEVVMLDGFVFAPGKSKRDYLQYIEHIFSSVQF